MGFSGKGGEARAFRRLLGAQRRRAGARAGRANDAAAAPLRVARGAGERGPGENTLAGRGDAYLRAPRAARTHRDADGDGRGAGPGKHAY